MRISDWSSDVCSSDLRLIGDARLMSGDARKLLRVGLANYAAGALLMPYGRFAEAALAERHDVERLAQRFGVSFEQVCHRLSTLQRPGARGRSAEHTSELQSLMRISYAVFCLKKKS